MKKITVALIVGFGVFGLLVAGFGLPINPTAWAISGTSCNDLPDHAALVTALEAARAEDNGGFNLDMWGTIVNRDGEVCAVAFTGDDRGDQWPGSRAISAQKHGKLL